MPITTHNVYTYVRVCTGFYCPGGPRGDYFVCKRGFYCPTPAEQYPCPAGKYCPSGTLHPYGECRQRTKSSGFVCGMFPFIHWLRLRLLTDCMPLSTCPEEAWQQRWFLLLLLLAVASVCAYIAYKRYAAHRRALSLSPLKAPTLLPGSEQHTPDTEAFDQSEKSKLKGNTFAYSNRLTSAHFHRMRLWIAQLVFTSTDEVKTGPAASGPLHGDVRVDVPAVPSVERSETSARYICSAFININLMHLIYPLWFISLLVVD